MKIQFCKKSLLKKNLLIYLSVLLIWGLIGCEFEVPTMPRLPARWNSKLIIPLLKKDYSFQDLVYDSTSSRNNQIFADTSYQRMYYFAVDTPGQALSVSDDYWKIPGMTFEKQINLATSIKAGLNDLVPVYQTKALGKISTRNCYVVKGALNSDDGTGINAARISAILSETLSNDLDIEIIARNFKNADTDTIWIDTLHLAADSLSNQLTMSFADDSLFSKNRTSFIDSLEFGLTIMIRDTLREELSQNLMIRFEIGTLHLDSFYGRPIASGYLTGQEFLSSPDGADGILFDNANADITLQDVDDYDSIHIVISGKNQFRTDVTIDSAFTISGTAYRLDLAPVMAVLPDSITFYVEAAQPLMQYDGSSISDKITVGYQLYAPLLITLPAEMQLAAANPTRFFITDSLTRSNISRSQNGAQLDISITNRTPFRGSLLLLIGNQRVFPADSAEASNYTGFEYINDTLYYISTDTELVIIDTLAVVELPLATMQDDSLVSAGWNNQVYFADSSALALIADTCYFLPKFHLLNPDTSRVFLQSDYRIEIKSYLNLLFDPAVLNQTVTDTTG
ncbi:MAG: hypothetical protein Q7J65_07035 [Candidatus Marinimicrobia bacterium]|nr:hypothetical protein [Candidatus Neomarinimicrobiota bacterium]